MSNAILEQNDEGVICVSGTLGFDHVAALLLASEPFFAGQADLAFNLNSVEKTDSAGLALLVEWMAMAQRSGQGICFQEIPEQMLEIARVSGLDGILPIV
ncbi:MAG: phospholipid transport system transporter-binding protein [Cycloclasticus pugetii]|jgi:phospholipid transport system transporter-binding protein|uniref:Anti-sigma-factor antagonist n=1 Tax=Cycloclasticus zancles 78-ME TaxID=1198232 RepID=S5TVL6_9GAMM|nr:MULTISPECIES: STAS domain-containing protein [Cycloclasticus]AGS39160.1 Anti-sigma-factor antagonist [Cycloclasticus zancles 78-ME]MBV1898972.1 STAS domain-containing protein [Cycloclasticus sp.]MDF1828757.1 STAS domain-containing protein [Cycloclasticus pugetii]